MPIRRLGMVVIIESLFAIMLNLHAPRERNSTTSAIQFIEHARDHESVMSVDTPT